MNNSSVANNSSAASGQCTQPSQVLEDLGNRGTLLLGCGVGTATGSPTEYVREVVPSLAAPSDWLQLGRAFIFRDYGRFLRFMLDATNVSDAVVCQVRYQPAQLLGNGGVVLGAMPLSYIHGSLDAAGDACLGPGERGWFLDIEEVPTADGGPAFAAIQGVRLSLGVPTGGELLGPQVRVESYATNAARLVLNIRNETSTPLDVLGRTTSSRVILFDADGLPLTWEFLSGHAVVQGGAVATVEVLDPLRARPIGGQRLLFLLAPSPP